ncbi:C45 family autoproteolytic acyltransferase/hydolase [Rhodovulum adriaticum]|uniref:Acyl-CoA:6-aminopenicillanic acid acyl transferase n=1 Tax=Rhodovulum adriaticum TaxID=35804 RepID=A0A4R2NIR3_RHOAD|nr:C45 family peptidase [Rhodovulum adriaticum]MBK1635389.1 6-aminopenicillanic acid acyl-transferase [Rhodovulum adriaticum]TCP21095.1 acyl-CoA:6-aminopenicillanic acid acyl transferase [Rhodovulum adriaticum]
MSNSGRNDLGWQQAAGTPFDIGASLGAHGRDAVHRHLIASPIWHRVNAPDHADRLARLTRNTQQRFPAIWAEIEGLAAGLDLPVGQVMAWNCRGDLLASAPDGCTTVQLPGPHPVIAHNEDGLPFFRGHCFVAEVQPDSGPGFLSFCYPGSLPGHTFALTTAGLVQAVNNLRLLGIEPQVPRMVLGRATLAAGTRDKALPLLQAAPPSGGFHFTLGQRGDHGLIGIEFGTGHPATHQIAAPALHANHALRMDGPQIVTASSRDRQARGDALLADGVDDALAILRDTGGPGLPIRRDDPEDPDCENTLATALFRIGKNNVEWTIYDRVSEHAAYRSGDIPHRAA